MFKVTSKAELKGRIYAHAIELLSGIDGSQAMLPSYLNVVVGLKEIIDLHTITEYIDSYLDFMPTF